MIKVMSVFGTRPEAIKMCPLVNELKSRDNIETIVCVTGQHRQMLDQVLEIFDLHPQHDLNIMQARQTLAGITTRALTGLEEVMGKEKPDIVLVHGDTSTTFAGALAAYYNQVKVGHVEAGLRSFDETMPEEINRLAADICSKLYFVPTEESAINLAMEGISRKRIFITGNTVVDACFRNLEISKNREKDEYDEGLAELDIDNMENILTLTMHRAETVDDKERLINIIEALEELDDMNIIFPIHPRTKKTMENFGLFDRLNDLDHVHIIKPVGYLDFLLLISKSTIILTDSGGLQEEAITLDVPALTLRYNTERPETVTAGGNILVGSDKEVILENARRILDDEDFANEMKSAKNPYGMGNAAELMIKIIEDADKNDNLKMEAPDEVMSSFTRKMKVIDEDISVDEFENNNSSLIKIAFDGEEIKFPYDDLNLKGLTIIYEDYAN